MSRSVFSDRWYRVVGLRPRLRSNVRVDRQLIRDEIWFLLSVGGKAKTHRLNVSAWAFVGRCDGERTVQQIWDMLLAANAEETPTQGEVVQLLTQLYKAGVMEFEQSPDVELMISQSRRERRQETIQRANPLSFRVPLGDPSRLMERCSSVAAIVYSGGGLLVWSLVVAVGLAMALVNFDELARHGERWLATPRYVVIAWLIYPVIKLIHEFGHALAVQRWGGQVREAGIGLFMLLPVPYVDASESSLFGHRYQRALVSAAGIMAELLVAALGLFVWANAQPGLVQDIGFTVAFVGGVSTVFFNANPLMRLDGYYLLCDLTELPNLAVRSTQHWQSILLRKVLRVADVPEQTIARGERFWLLAYSPTAWMYRVLVVVWLLVWAGGYHPMLGLMVGGLAVFTMILLPLGLGVRQVVKQIPAGRGQRGARARFTLAGAAVLALFVAVPLPDRSLAQGVVWLPEQAQVRSQVEGFLSAMLPLGTRARTGQPVVALDDPALEIEHRKLVSRREGLETALYQTLLTDIFKSKQVGEEIASIDERLRDVRERRAQLNVTAAQPGQFAVRQASDMPGKFFKQGETIGYLIGAQRPVVRVAVPQEDAAALSQGVRAVSVRLAQLPGREFSGRLARATPSAVDRLPSAALGDRAGGDIVVDPTDKDGTRAVAPIYVIDVEVDEIPAHLIGGRAWVRFEYGWASAASQGYRQLRQLLLYGFSPVES